MGAFGTGGVAIVCSLSTYAGVCAIKTLSLTPPAPALPHNISVISAIRKEEAPRRLTPTRQQVNCSGIRKILRRTKDMSIMAQLWDLSCEDRYKCDVSLPDMSNGCLYVSTNTNMRKLLGHIGRPNPCGFLHVFVNSFFLPGACPEHRETLIASPTTRSHGGFVYAGCQDGVFSASTGECVRSRLLGVEKDQAISVYALDAVMGMPDAWEKAMVPLPTITLPDPPLEVISRQRSRLAERITVEFYACGELADRSELEQLAKAQVETLQAAHDGRISCAEDTLLYDPHQSSFLEKGLSFSTFDPQSDLKMIDDEMCAKCDYLYKSLWGKYMSVERGGKVKVLLCAPESVLGSTEGPWNSPSGIMIDYRTMPGGSSYGFNMGRTLVHEMGHYFGLMHTFQDQCMDGDGVSDTDAEEVAFFGCPKVDDPSQYKSCGGEAFDPIHNFLDYADDQCMCAFTHEQYKKMRKAAEDFVY